MTARPTHAAPLVEEAPIVFFDGECGLCDRFVQLLLQLDEHNRLRFAPLQGETAARLLPAEAAASLDSVVVLSGGRFFRRSRAIVEIGRILGGVWGGAAWLFWLIPGPLRDVAYRGVARVRYQLFGRRAACRLPTPEQQSRFLE